LRYSINYFKPSDRLANSYPPIPIGYRSLNSATMCKFIAIIFISFSFSIISFAQVTTVIDGEHITTTKIEAITAGAATGLKQFFESPFIENISKVQTFFKEASQLVSKIVQNLRMTRQLIETEKEIYELFVRSLDQIDKAEDSL